MKKTIIALVALAGAAMGDTYTAAEANSWLKEAGKTVGGSKYTLTFTIADTFQKAHGTGTTIFTLATLSDKAWTINQQDGRYLGLGDGGSPDGSYDSRNDATVNFVDTDTAGANSTADYSGWFYDSGSNGTALGGASFTIASGNGYTDITFTTADGSRSITLNRSTFLGLAHNGAAGNSVIKFEEIELSSVSIKYDDGTLTIPAKETPAIPEPTTATLSLLALAGLAARRRRK